MHPLNGPVIELGDPQNLIVAKLLAYAMSCSVMFVILGVDLFDRRPSQIR